MESIRIELVGLPPSQNKRRHHMTRYRDDQQWKSDAAALAMNAVNRSGLTGFPWRRVHVRYIFHYQRTTLADLDNLLGSMKPCLDGVKGIAFTDDNVTCVHDLSASVEVVKGVPNGVAVLVTRCECAS